MTFVNGILALGALAFSVPLIIHLLFRSRFRTVDWGAMHLLDTVVRINRRRIQLLHLLLLLLRCLLPVLLAFCLARPVLTGFQSLPGDEPQSLVIAIDDSRSMSARDESGLTRMDRAKAGIASLLKDLSRRDEVMLVRSSRIGSPATTQGAQEAVGDLRKIQAEYGPVDLGTLMRGAVEAADGASHPQRRILVIGDFPGHSVEDAAMSSLSRIGASLAEKSLRPVVSFWNLGVDSNQLENVSVDSISVDSPALVADRTATFSAKIRNSSDIPVRDLRATWLLDGEELKSGTVTVPPRSHVTARLAHAVESVGVHELSFAVERADALIADNRRSIGIDVIQEINVLLVDGKPSSSPLEGETDYLAVALSPFAFGGQDQPDVVRTRVVAPRQISVQLETDRPDVLILANVDQIGGKTRQLISQYVLDGGSLVVFDGDQIRPDTYNQPWESKSGSWRLPAKLGSIVGGSASENANRIVIGGRNPVYSPWNVLGGNDQQPFANVELYGYRQLLLETRDDDAPDDDASNVRSVPLELWSTLSGDPLAVKAQRGRGQVVQFAVGCDADWTTLPVRLVYLPMMQQLVLDLAGNGQSTTVDIGQGFTVPVRELASLIDAAEDASPTANATFAYDTPSGIETRLEPSDDESPVLSVRRTDEVGKYLVRMISPSPSKSPNESTTRQSTTRQSTTIRVIDVPALESQLRDADASRLDAAAEMLDGVVYTELSDLQSDDRTRRYGREIWRWLLVLMLIAMVLELWLQQRTAKTGSMKSSALKSSALGVS